MLGKIKQLERSGDWDVIVVDGPAAGHAITFLLAAAGLLDAVRGGPVRTQADDVAEMLGDPARPGRARHAARDDAGQRGGPDGVRPRGSRRRQARPGRRQRVDGLHDEPAPDPDTVELDAGPDAGLLTAPPTSAASRRQMQDEEIARLGRELALEQWHLPLLPVAGLDAEHVKLLAGGAAGRPVTTGLDDALDGAEVVVSCGSGGVGKTTTAAVIGLEAARLGRRAVVVTIDPARRLADALGLPDGLAAEPQRIELDEWRRASCGR